MRVFFTALLFCAALLTPSPGRAENPLQEETEQFFPLPLDGAITLEHTDGAIRIFGWYEPRVRLVAQRKAYTAERLRQIRVATEAQPSALVVRTVIPAATGFLADRSGTIDYTLIVPEKARLKMKLINGEISLQGLRGATAEIELTNGRITARNCFAQIRARSAHGVMEVFYDWWENLPAAFEFVLQQGRMVARLPAAARFQVEARTSSGRIHDGFRLGTVADNGSGQTLSGASAPQPTLSLDLRTGGGNISLEPIR